MLNLLKTLYQKAQLQLMLRNEHTNEQLRKYFSRNYAIEVGTYSYGCFDRWRVPPKTRIGRYCSFAKSSRIVDANHPSNALTTHPVLYESRFGLGDLARPVHADWMIIEDDVWIGHNATVLPGCKRIGRGAIVGAGALVTKDVPSYAIVAGTPAKLVRMRFEPAIIQRIEQSRWWELNVEEIRFLVSRFPDVFFNPENVSVDHFSMFLAERDNVENAR
jgi:virginiamycin A acetyltransferase